MIPFYVDLEFLQVFRSVGFEMNGDPDINLLRGKNGKLEVGCLHM
jgi:hypothetical protein